jgi:hypothetical protein
MNKLTELFRKRSGNAPSHRHRVSTAGHVEHLSALDEVIDRTVDLCMNILARSPQLSCTSRISKAHETTSLFSSNIDMLPPGKILLEPKVRPHILISCASSRTLYLCAESG